MASAAVDHMISLTIFMVAILLFIGLFSQSIQTAVVYESHRVLSTKTSDLLDSILLNPGLPTGWAKTDSPPDCFGLQDPDYPQYKLSTFSLMRLSAGAESKVYYPRTDAYYCNTTGGFGGYLLAPQANVLNHSDVSKTLGINGTYGFQLTLTPILNVSISKVSDGTPLTLDIKVDGTGYPLANGSVTYSLYLVDQNQNHYPSFTKFSDTTTTDESGYAQVTFESVNSETQSYAFLFYVHLYGLKGMGYYVHVPQTLTESVVPIVDSFADRSIVLAHSDSIGETTPQDYSKLSYNASFAILTELYTLRQVVLEQTTSFGNVTVGAGLEPDFAVVNVPDNDGILIVTYKDTVSGQVGIVLMPWGLGSMAFPVTLGANSNGQEWVTTDIRQVTIGGFAYEAKLSLWNLKGFQGVA